MTEIDDLAADFGARLRSLRSEAALSQEGLAQRANLHPTYISQVERGRRNPTLATLVRLADALNVSLPQLVDFS